MPSDKLLPCPFCGQAPAIRRLSAGDATIECMTPACIRPRFSRPTDWAIRTWNRRAPAVTREEVARVLTTKIKASPERGKDGKIIGIRIDVLEAENAILALLNKEPTP